MWSRSPPVIIGLIVMTVVLLFLHHEFSARVAPILLISLLAFMAANVIGLAAAIAAFSVPRWRSALSARFWASLKPVFSIGFCGGIAASVWILMPVSDGDLRMLMVFLYMWFIAMVVMADGSRVSAFCSMWLVASLAIFVLLDGMPYAVPLAAFLVMAGVAILSMRRFIWRAADEAAAARAQTERTAEALNDALALVTAERDAKTRFLASASHDLQQPLHAASLYFDQVVGNADDPLRDRAVAGVRSALTSTQNLLGSMLDYLRLEADAMPARVERVAVGAVLAGITLEHGAAARAAGMRLVTVHTDAAVMADGQLLKRVIGNLVTNAVRHARGKRILLGVRRHGDRVRLWVIDDGEGIAEADLARLFDDYAQGSNHGAENRGGFGLGLASARRMVALMKGEIALDRRWTGGSAFCIDLAAAESRSAAKAADIQCRAA